MDPILPYVTSLTTSGLSPDDGKHWDALVAEQRRWLTEQVPRPLQPVGEPSWTIATDCLEPTPPGMVHYRFELRHTRQG